MPVSETLKTVRAAPGGGLRCAETGAELRPPPGWEFLPSGDATLTRRVKAAGAHWVLEEQQRKRLVSRGVWAPAERIQRLRAAWEQERATPAYALRLSAQRRRRARAEADYAEDFAVAVVDFLGFAPAYAALGEELAARVAAHATPVGSGTVARTKRISLERRVEAAVIAWMRHQTTAYDRLSIPRVKGKRREVRRALAQRSRQLLEGYRRGLPTDAEACPLQRALRQGQASGSRGPDPQPRAELAPDAEPRREPASTPAALPPGAERSEPSRPEPQQPAPPRRVEALRPTPRRSLGGRAEAGPRWKAGLRRPSRPGSDEAPRA